jgi:predicted HTH domain antitoxin
MDVVRVLLPAELLAAAGVNPADASKEATLLLALELYRENKISLGRAAELSQTSVETFIIFADRHEASLHYGISDLEEDRRTLEHLSS